MIPKRAAYACETCGSTEDVIYDDGNLVCRKGHATRNRVAERLKWWRTDLAYKAPEQIDGRYVSALLEDLEKVANL